MEKQEDFKSKGNKNISHMSSTGKRLASPLVKLLVGGRQWKRCLF